MPNNMPVPYIENCVHMSSAEYTLASHVFFQFIMHNHVKY